MAEFTTKPNQTVVLLEGTAFRKDASGQLIALKPGDQVGEGQTLVTDGHGHAKLLLPTGDVVEIGPDRELKVDGDLASAQPVDRSEVAIAGTQTITDKILGALNSDKDLSIELDPTAAGLDGGSGADGGHGFVRLARVVEGIDPLAFDYKTPVLVQTEIRDLGAASGQEVEPPVADGLADANENVTIAEDTSASGNVLAGTTSVDGTLSVTGFTVGGTSYTAGQTATLAGVGTLTIGSDGAYSFVPAANYNGPVPVATYTVTDGVNSDTSTLTITVNPVDDAFTDNNETVSVNEDTTLSGSVLMGTSSVDGPVTVTTFTVAGNATVFNAGQSATITGVGTLTLNSNGSYTFVPAANYNGAVPVVTYTVSDGSSTDTSTLSITVSPLNDAPVSAGGSATGLEDTSLVLSWNQFGVSDVDGGPAPGIQITGLPSDGVLQYQNSSGIWVAVTVNQVISQADISAGKLQFVPDSHESGQDVFGGSGAGNKQADYASFTFQPVDGSTSNSVGSSATFRIDITPDADAPTLTVRNNAEQIFQTGWETAGNTNTSSQSVAGPTFEGWTLVTTSDTQAGGTNAFEIWATGDSQQRQDASSNTVTAMAGNGNNFLELNDAGQQVQTLGIERTITTVAGQVYDLSFDYAGRPGFNANYTRIAVYLDGVKLGTYAGTSPMDALKWETLRFAFNGDGQAHTLKIVTEATEFNTGGRGAMIDDITLTTSQGAVVTAGGTSLALSNYINAALVDTDGSETLGLQLSGLPSGATVVVGSTVYSGSTVTLTPAQLATASLRLPDTFSGNLTLGVTAISTEPNGDTASTSSTLNLNILKSVDVLAAGNDNVTTNEDAVLTLAPSALLANDTDSNGDPLTITSVQGATHGTVALVNGNVVFTPEANYNGPASFSYTVSDGKGGITTATVNVTVNPVDDAFSDANEAVSGDEDTTLTGSVLTGTSSVDGAVTVTQFAVSGTTYTVPAGGSATATLAAGALTINADGSYSFVPAANYNGSVPVVTYTLSDGSSTDTSTLTIAVNPVNDAPVDGNETNSVTEDGALTVANGAAGDLLNNATDVENNPVSITGYTIAGISGTQAVGSAVSIAGVGSLTINANGSYSFTPVKDYAGTVPVITYTVSDGQGGTDTSTLTLTVNPVNDAPVITGQASATVSEEGLAGGLIDSTGSPTDTSNAKTASGTVTIADVDSASLTVSLSAPTTTLTSGGQTVTWSLSADKHTLIGSAGGAEALRVVIDDSGKYTVTLSKPIDHTTANVEDLKSFDIGLSVSDGALSATGKLTVTVEDDAPVASNSASTVQLQSVNTNILLVLDTSGSMIWDGAGNDIDDPNYSGMSRLETMKQAVMQMLDQYDNQGDVKVRIVTFHSDATEQDATWVTVARAKEIVASLEAGGGTDYDAALAAARAAFTDSGKLTGAQNVSYFISDGEPTEDNGTGSNGITAAEETTWTTFLNNQKINSYSYGIGSGANNFKTELNPIAYDGHGTSGVNKDAVIVADIEQLPPILRDSVMVPQSGNLFGSLDVGVGADSGYIYQLTLDGTTYSYNPAAGGSVTVSGTDRGVFDTTANTLTINTLLGGKLVIDLDNGDYQYTPAGNVNYTTQESFNYTVKDNDGDAASALHQIQIVPPGGGDAGMSTTLINGRDGNDQITMLSNVETSFYLQLGGYGSTAATTQTVVTETKNQIIDAKGGNDYVEGGQGNDVIYLGDSGNNVHSVTGKAATQADVLATNLMSLGDSQLVGTDGNLTTTARYTSASSTKSSAEWSDLGHGGAGDDTIHGQAGVDLIYGGSGNDKLYGGAGADGLRGGAGDDLLVGGAGDDVLRGDLGSDTFQWTLADAGAVGSPAKDIIMDFDVKAGSAGGDVLDLQDLLSGPANSTVGQLTSYLHFEVSGSNTIVHISSSGAYGADGAQYSASKDNQTITLQNVNLPQALGLDVGATDAQIIQDLLIKGKLHVD